MDANVATDSAQPDANVDAAPEDAGFDAGPPDMVGLCEACEEHEECGPGNFCANLSTGEKACVAGCNPDLPSCARGFNCVIDFMAGTDGNAVCLPVGEACCIDEDADEYGQGIGCLGPDCDDEDEGQNPGVTEICDGIDQDCDGVVDDPPTDCVSGRCTADGDGTFSSISGGTCEDTMCADGSFTDCLLFTCVDGGDVGTTCATSCNVAGVDEDDRCIEAAHCDVGACIPDVPNGGMCDEDSDCEAGRCDNGFCCDSGTCCSETSDCPGGGTVTTLCDDAMTCQGSRGETTCNDDFQCETLAGIPDDSACDGGVEARNCDPYLPVFCDGTTNQTPPSCPTSCSGDGQCIDSAHCEGGLCIPDRPAGGVCSRSADCQGGLFCVDGRCCTGTCDGTCEACDLPGSEGTCTPVPAMADVDNECAGFSCGSYYGGFVGGSDSCFTRQNVSDSGAACNGARACIGPETLCPLQPLGTLQIDCNNTCQSPVAGTCVGTNPGICRDLDDVADTVSCGTGECQRTVQRCVGGTPSTCSPGAPSVETCNTLDDDCDGTPDDGSGAALCPPVTGGLSYMCTAGTCSFTCATGRFDVNGVYDDGCECTADTGGGNACAAPSVVGTINPGDPPVTLTGVIPDGGSQWYQVTFPNGTRGPTNGNPSVNFTGASAANFRMSVFTGCGMSATCEMGSASSTSSYSFIDDQSPSDGTSTIGNTDYSGPHSVGWPATVLVQVTRVNPVTACTEAVYSITFSR